MLLSITSGNGFCSFILKFHSKNKEFYFRRDDTYTTTMQIFQFSRPLIPHIHLRPMFFHPLDLGRPISNEPPLQMITSQLKEKKIQGWLLYVIRSFLQIGLRFECQLAWISFDFFSSETSQFAFWWLYTQMRAAVGKYHEMSFIYNSSHFLITYFAINLFYLYNLKT